MQYKILSKQNIKIDSGDVFTLKEFNLSINKEEDIRNKLIEIIQKNTFENTVVKLIDLKNAYEKKLKSNGITGVTQIMKNTIGSNKNNRTHLLRNKNLDWYYVDNSFCSGGYLDVDKRYRKPLPLPTKLERSKTKHYYVFFTNDFSDSPTLNTSVTERIFVKPVVAIKDIDFESIEKNKKDYISDYMKAQEIGEFGENYVFDLEKKYLKKNKINLLPVWVSKKSDKYGFDIQSYRKINNSIEKIFIEVKTTSGGLKQAFFVSENEYKTSLSLGIKYYVFRVYDASDESTIKHKEYNGSFNSGYFSKINTEITYSYKVV